MTRLILSILMIFLLGDFTEGQSRHDAPNVINGKQKPMASKFSTLENKFFFTFTLPKTDSPTMDDSKIEVYLKTFPSNVKKDQDTTLTFDSPLEEYKCEIGDLKKSSTGEIYVQYMQSSNFKAMHIISYNFYALNKDNYDPQKPLRVRSKNGAMNIDFVKHNETILMPIMVTTTDDLPHELPANFNLQSKVYQVSFLDDNSASFVAYASISYEADKNDENVKILRFNKESNNWDVLGTQLNREWADAKTSKLGFFVLVEEDI